MALLNFIETVVILFEKGHIGRGIFIDFSKAFDHIDPTILISTSNSELLFSGINLDQHAITA